jgi:exodeoxyribonuclease V gamma subunit
MPTQLFFSNNIESLAETFARQIAAQHDPFEPGTIIVPNPYLKKWLQLKIAATNGIALNLNFQYLNDGLWAVVSRLFPAPSPAMLEQEDLHLMLYHSLSALDQRTGRVKPLFEYLCDIDNARGADFDKRAWQLSSRLARYFLEYEFYRGDMIKAWLKGNLLFNTDMEAAQQHLYFSVFKKGGYRDMVNPDLRTLFQYWESASARSASEKSLKLYLFGKTQLSPFHVRLIYELGTHLDITIYQMNPCAEFWEDVTTPAEDRWKRIRSIAIQKNSEGDFLAENENENPLLKQWGKTGRESVKLLSLLEEAGSRELSFVSRWIYPDRPHPGKTCLKIIQERIFQRTAGDDPPKKIPQDTSVQAASCTDIFREAEAVYESILYNLDREPGLKMTDIAVMVPDMSAYGPVLESVFSRYPKKIAFTRIDSSAMKESLFGKALNSLLEIASGSFNLKEVFELINNQCFLAACSMTAEDAAAWLSWAGALNIFHGFSKYDGIDPARNLHTWRQGLERLRLGRIMQSAEPRNGIFLDYKHIVPYADMDTNDQRRIDTFNLMIELLYHAIKDLPAQKASARDWIGIIEKLMADFIAVPAGRSEEKQVLNELRSCLRKLTVLDGLSQDKGAAPLSFAFIREFISEGLTAISSPGGGGYLTGGVNLSALVPKRQIPFKITYIMGMQEGLFPGAGDSSTLNLMNMTRKIGDVTRPDVNRYLFLETLLGTGEKLYITYISKDLQKDQDFHPNSVVGQLITYMSHHVTSEEFKIVKVPSSGSSLEYLRAGDQTAYSDLIASRLDGKYQPTNFSESNRLVLLRDAARNFKVGPAVSTAVSGKLKARDFQIPVPSEQAVRQGKAVSISIRDLVNYLINPMEAALRWHLRIYDDNEENRAEQEDEPFYSGYRIANRFVSEALGYYVRSGSKTGVQKFIDEYYAHAQLMSMTPEGAFAKVDLDEIRAVIIERMSGRKGLSDFIQVRKDRIFYQNVTFGSVRFTAKPDRAFPPARCGIATHDQALAAELSGMFPYLWKNKDSGEFETLVITNSSKPSVISVINPFLAYVISVSGYEKDLQQFMGSAAFTVYISYKNGIARYRYRLNQAEGKEYLDRLLLDFLDESGFDFLPVQIVSDKRLLAPPVMEAKPEESDRREYRRALVGLISDDGDKLFPSIRGMNFTGILEAEVPPDAYDKVRDRLGILLKPFMQGEEQE